MHVAILNKPKQKLEVFPITKQDIIDNEGIEDYLIRKGYTLSQISFMLMEDKPNISLNL